MQRAESISSSWQGRKFSLEPERHVDQPNQAYQAAISAVARKEVISASLGTRPA
jgi:hypothetical protein